MKYSEIGSNYIIVFPHLLDIVYFFAYWFDFSSGNLITITAFRQTAFPPVPIVGEKVIISTLTTRWQCVTTEHGPSPKSKRHSQVESNPCDLCNGCRLALLSSYCPSFRLISLWRSKWPCASVCVPTLINPWWTSINSTVHLVHLLIVTVALHTHPKAVEPCEANVAFSLTRSK